MTSDYTPLMHHLAQSWRNECPEVAQALNKVSHPLCHAQDLRGVAFCLTEYNSKFSKTVERPNIPLLLCTLVRWDQIHAEHNWKYRLIKNKSFRKVWNICSYALGHVAYLYEDKTSAIMLVTDTLEWLYQSNMSQKLQLEEAFLRA